MKNTATDIKRTASAGKATSLRYIPALTILLSLVILFSSSLPANAQMIDRMGIQASGNLSTVVTSPNDPYSSRKPNFGYGIGLFTETDFSERTSFMFGAELSSRRYEFSNRSDSDQHATQSLYFISVPLMLKIRGSGSFSRFYGKVGPRFDFFLASQHDAITSCSSFECHSFGDSEVVGYAKTVVPGWSGALGTNMRFLDTPFSMELRFNDDLSGMNSDQRKHPAQKISFDLWISIPLTSEKPSRSAIDGECHCLP